MWPNFLTRQIYLSGWSGCDKLWISSHSMRECPAALSLLLNLEHAIKTHYSSENAQWCNQQHYIQQQLILSSISVHYIFNRPILAPFFLPVSPFLCFWLWPTNSELKMKSSLEYCIILLVFSHGDLWSKKSVLLRGSDSNTLCINMSAILKKGLKINVTSALM